ncbi:hypothetical protein ABZP36_009177 [Zizania latifolia]
MMHALLTARHARVAAHAMRKPRTAIAITTTRTTTPTKKTRWTTPTAMLAGVAAMMIESKGQRTFAAAIVLLGHAADRKMRPDTAVTSRCHPQWSLHLRHPQVSLLNKQRATVAPSQPVTAPLGSSARQGWLDKLASAPGLLGRGPVSAAGPALSLPANDAVTAAPATPPSAIAAIMTAPLPANVAMMATPQPAIAAKTHAAFAATTLPANAAVLAELL